MKKFLMIMVCATFLCVATTAMAASIYYQSTDVNGPATITYDNDDGTDPPKFSFVATSGTVDENLSSFTAGNYRVSLTLNGFWIDIIDINGDVSRHFNIPDTTLSDGPYYIPSLPSHSGSYGQLTWDIDPYSGGSISYDFGTTGPYTNAEANAYLAQIDSFLSSGTADGTINANIGWNRLRIELNHVPIPSTILLLGSGLLGLAGFGRKRFSIKE